MRQNPGDALKPVSFDTMFQRGSVDRYDRRGRGEGGGEVSRFQGFEVSRFQGFKVSRFRGFETADWPMFRADDGLHAKQMNRDYVVI
jgi:hypothetical protein